ncbi:Peptidase C14, caspase catalytic subunit p20 [Lysobacter dokdonensis DS-58]|uniref:Peptidase C14, caspase catalytic subunit p20 n=1 Tax=Lysobacter dokdonensis DS-58 TaxID=1300345 RepID=A0A0A2X5A3_9GAMM|nr:hypothetical protein [Lysobacter dokdonensis]KGQ20449.1 Peptidase C14, caspase catalytic subunit p20 [Lysobacter dokdonensis DS-58]
MPQMSWTTRWESWRELMGRPRTPQRRRVEAFLQKHPALLYWGDSWFSTPLYLNLARQSLLRITGMAMVVGKPGATASDLFAPRNVDSMIDRINGSPFDVLCLSAGGNDQLSERLATSFAAWQPPHARPKITAQAAFDLLMQAGGFAPVLASYTRVLDAVRRKVVPARPTFRVVGHTYAPLQRIGAAADLTVENIGLIAWIKDDIGPWLWKPMQHVLIDVGEGKAFADLLLFDGFRDQVLEPLSHTFAGLFSYADFESFLPARKPSFWYDEIHPTEAGFAQLAAPFNNAVRSALPPVKWGAVE